MLSDINNSKEVIKNRMLRHALTYWGIKNAEELDPSVKLIMEALSSELYKLGHEIEDTQVRILEKISNLLAPDFSTAPNPSHAILHAHPLEATELLTATTLFTASKKIAATQGGAPDTTLDISFTPVDAVQLFDVTIDCMISGGSCWSCDNSFSKQLKIHNKGKIFETSTLWLGLSVNKELARLDKLHFYFDWKNLDTKLSHGIFQLLPLTEWWLNGEKIHTAQGLNYVASQAREDSFGEIFSAYDLLNLLERDVKQYYDHKFISIPQLSINNIEEEMEYYPESCRSIFADTDLQKLNKKLLWLKIVFPAAVDQALLNDLFVYTNAFPVMNRQINDLKYRLRGGSNIIPLKTNHFDQFLSVKSLTDYDHVYLPVPYRKMEEERSGTYTLRSGGIERFDERNAKEMISYLLDLLRGESAAFSAYGYDFIASTLKEMNQKISLMEQKTGSYKNGTEIPYYLIVKPFEGFDMMYAEYWTTLAEAANNIKSGTKLLQGKAVKVKQDSVLLLTTTVGGRNRLKPEERLNAFRYGMMTRDRIITKHDIQNFCFHEVGEHIQHVDVERGFEMSNNPKQGFRRTIDVMLTPVDRSSFDRKEWETICEQVKAKLQVRSGVSNYYRVLIKDETTSIM